MHYFMCVCVCLRPIIVVSVRYFLRLIAKRHANTNYSLLFRQQCFLVVFVVAAIAVLCAFCEFSSYLQRQSAQVNSVFGQKMAKKKTTKDNNNNK